MALRGPLSIETRLECVSLASRGSYTVSRSVPPFSPASSVRAYTHRRYCYICNGAGGYERRLRNQRAPSPIVAAIIDGFNSLYLDLMITDTDRGDARLAHLVDSCGFTASSCNAHSSLIKALRRDSSEEERYLENRRVYIGGVIDMSTIKLLK